MLPTGLWHWIAVAHAADPTLPNIPQSAIDETAGTGVTILLNRIVDTLTFFAYPLALAGLLYSAYLLITSFGNPDAYAKAKKNVIFLLTGIFLIVGAVALTNLMIRILNPAT